MLLNFMLFGLNLRIRLRFTMKPSQHLLRFIAAKDEHYHCVSR